MNAPHLLIAAALLAALPISASAEEPDFFAKTPYRWRSADSAKRFPRTRLAQALKQPPTDPACARVVATFLMGFAEAAPYFHKKDENYLVFPTILAPVSRPDFPAADYLREMVRVAMLEKKAPEAWLETAKQLKAKYDAPIDLARLAYAVDGPAPIDSIYFSIEALRQEYVRMVELAPTLAQGSGAERFRDRYLDRDVTWSGLVLYDVHKEEPPRPKRGKALPPAPEDEESAPAYIATLLVPTMATESNHPLLPQKKADPIRVRVKLHPSQYLDLKRAVVSGRYVVRGRLWEFKVGDGSPGTPPMDIELRDGLLFEDHDWSRYSGFVEPGDVERCALCVNDLSPFGLKEKQGAGVRDGFSH